MEVCRDSFGRLGVTGRGAGIVDMIASVDAVCAGDIAMESWRREGATGSGRCKVVCEGSCIASITVREAKTTWFWCEWMDDSVGQGKTVGIA